MASFRAANLSLLAALPLVPFVWNDFIAYQLGLYVLYGIAGQGIALCWGRAGFLPLGQALFFGIGAYLSGAALKEFGESWPILLPCFLGAILVPALLAGVLGMLVFKRRLGSGPYFSLITLAVAMLGFQLANSQIQLTGGFNGMTGIPGLPGIDSYDGLYFVIIGILAVVSLGLARLTRSPFGQIIRAIHQNEERAQLLGFNSGLLKAVAFAISAGLAGLAGVLYAPHQGIVTPQAVGFLLSAEFVIWTAVGGRNSFAGPVVGAIAIGFLASGLRDSFRYWEIVVALAFVVTVLRFPDGLLGAVERVFHLAGPDQRGTRRRSLEIADNSVPDPPDLIFEDVCLAVGPVNILKRLDFQVRSTGLHCLIGPNGAGKTSAFNVLTGKLHPSSGKIRWCGRNMVSAALQKRAILAVRRGFWG